MEQVKKFLLTYKRQSVVVVILISILLGLGLMKKITQILPYMAKEKNWSVPTWFDPYGVAGIGFVVAIIVIFLINWTFRVLMQDIEKED
jgi:hypothetical protein